MSTAPLISVCMPAYRHEDYVGHAIESILAQTEGNFELLIADDCSPDATFDVIRSYKDERITAWRTPQRSGPSVTLNGVMRRARGRYLALCSSDDRWLPQKLERQVAYLQAHPDTGAVFFRPFLIDATGQPLPDSAHPLGADFRGETLSRAQWLIRLFYEGNCLCAITPLFRTEAVRATGDFHPLMLQLQDFEYWLRFMTRHELHFMPERLAEYRVSSGASLSAATDETFARTAYECYQCLRHYAGGAPADALAALPLNEDSLLFWQPQSPSRALRLAEHALHVAASLPQKSFGHYLFALDCLNAHGQYDDGLQGAAGEGRLFPLPYFEVTGSSLGKNFFLGEERAHVLRQMSLHQTLPLQQVAADGRREAPRGLWNRLMRGIGRS